MTLDKLKYPIGKFDTPETIKEDILKIWISVIALFPEKLKKEVSNLTDAQLDTPYRPGGWTVRQLVHHCADSHMNSLTRFKLTLTEDNPTIKPYFEDRWAELPDSKTLPIDSSIKILEGIHERWITLLNNLTNQQLKRTFVHPEKDRALRLDETIGLYAWHCDHHLAHITTLKEREKW